MNKSAIFENLPSQLDFPVLLKISKRNYLESIHKGKLYMNNLQYFIDLEKRTGIKGIGDEQEASRIIIKRHELWVSENGGESHQIEIGPAPGIVYDKSSLLHPIFCLMYKNLILEKFATDEYSGILKLSDDEVKDFVSSSDNDYGVLIIFDIETFLDNIYKGAEKNGFQGRHGRIEYRDKRLPRLENGYIVPDNTFVKDIRFQNQSEFRIELYKDTKDPYIFDIGSLENISTITSLNTILQGLHITQKIYAEY